MQSRSELTQGALALVFGLFALSCASARPAADPQSEQGAGSGSVTGRAGSGSPSAAGSGAGADECRGPGRYESGKEMSYRPCCPGLNELSYRGPSYQGGVKVCVPATVRLYACVRGECGDGICEEAEARACGGCVADCPQAAWERPAPTAMDAGSPDDLMKCTIASKPCGGANSFCKQSEIAPHIADCADRPFTPYYAVRCGSYEGVVAQGTDSARYMFYDGTGKLVATNEVGLGAQGCVAYDPSFTLPSSCEITTPPCEDAGTE